MQLKNLITIVAVLLSTQILSTSSLYIINDSPLKMSVGGGPVYIKKETVVYKGKKSVKRKDRRVYIGQDVPPYTRIDDLGKAKADYWDWIHAIHNGMPPRNLDLLGPDHTADQYVVIELTKCANGQDKNQYGEYCYYVHHMSKEEWEKYWQQHGKDIQAAAKDGSLRKNYVIKKLN